MIDRVDEITDAFGLMGLRDGPHKIRDKDNNVIEKIMVESFWAMETAYFTKAESLTVAVVHTSS